ncbi:hypothetical protein VSH64_02640 [Amycolatopsis rhabdoformis]|uniref:Shikimate kinase n=1 Tax=Amycolatopsis rhabdoformis TaxID=1448059 RepID=A0ABZ1IA00_9PSEU|nr:hypothetical protein [Amycolatopsis rhabdoformis]WSE31027.1 hypothetical protein VSH64_02640 [Amycolatopsis rhabdoformis]
MRHSGGDELSRRIDGDEPSIREWRLEHLDADEKALPWLEESATVIDTEGRAPGEIARFIADADAVG